MVSVNFLFRLLVFKYKIEKTSFPEKFNFTVVLRTVKYLVSLFFGYWIEEIDVWVRRITRNKKNIRSKIVKKQVLLVLDWVRSHIENLILLTKEQYKRNTVSLSTNLEFSWGYIAFLALQLLSFCLFFSGVA